MLVVFKAARRQEYLQQNLRILSAQRGETVETAYGLRWQSEGLRRRPPEPGEEALIVFTSQPYREYTPARFARVVRCEREDSPSALRFELELGSRAHTTDGTAWQRFVLAGPNPSEASEVWALRLEDDQRRGAPVPVEYATAAQDDPVWRATIERLAADADYRAAVFLRVISVQPADDISLPALEPPYRLATERPYLVRVASYNPHIDADRLREVRVVPLYDELATALAARADEELPADGTLEMLLEPIVAGPGWLELNASLGLELVPTASLGWVAEAPPAGRAAESPRGEVPAGIMRAMTPPDPLAEAAVRAYALVRESGTLESDDRLRLLEHLRTIAPDEPRLAEQKGITLYEARRYDEAGRVLAAIPLDVLGAQGRATLVAAGLREGRLPEPIERVRVADLSRPEAFGVVLDASAALAAADQVRLAEFVAARLLSDDRAAAWLREVLGRPLPAEAVALLTALSADLGPGTEGEG